MLAQISQVQPTLFVLMTLQNIAQLLTFNLF